MLTLSQCMCYVCCHFYSLFCNKFIDSFTLFHHHWYYLCALGAQLLYMRSSIADSAIGSDHWLISHFMLLLCLQLIGTMKVNEKWIKRSSKQKKIALNETNKKKYGNHKENAPRAMKRRLWMWPDAVFKWYIYVGDIVNKLKQKKTAKGETH